MFALFLFSALWQQLNFRSVTKVHFDIIQFSIFPAGADQLECEHFNLFLYINNQFALEIETYREPVFLHWKYLQCSYQNVWVYDVCM